MDIALLPLIKQEEELTEDLAVEEENPNEIKILEGLRVQMSKIHRRCEQKRIAAATARKKITLMPAPTRSRAGSA
jgi:hypothetical protein